MLVDIPAVGFFFFLCLLFLLILVLNYVWVGDVCPHQTYCWTAMFVLPDSQTEDPQYSLEDLLFCGANEVFSVFFFLASRDQVTLEPWRYLKSVLFSSGPGKKAYSGLTLGSERANIHLKSVLFNTPRSGISYRLRQLNEKLETSCF